MTILDQLKDRAVPLRKLSLFTNGPTGAVGSPPASPTLAASRRAEGDPEATAAGSCPVSPPRNVLCSLPHGLKSLTVVSLAGEIEGAVAAEVAAAQAAGGAAVTVVENPLPTPMAPTRFDDLDLPDEAIKALADLEELKVWHSLKQ